MEKNKKDPKPIWSKCECGKWVGISPARVARYVAGRVFGIEPKEVDLPKFKGAQAKTREPA